MVDIETLSTRTDATITSIGACKFNFVSGITGTFKVNIDPKDSVKYGTHISTDTVEWWKKQPKEAVRGWTTNPQPLKESLIEFRDWLGVSKQTLWCKGLSFDFPIIGMSFSLIGEHKPWSHYQEMDLRTLFKVLNIDSAMREQSENDVTYHDALGDSIRQAKQLISLFDIEAF